MINLDIIEREIMELEARGDTTYSQCERLSWLYIVRDHLKPTVGESQRTWTLEGSEFLEAASGVGYEPLMRVIDEHMQAIRVVQPKEYDAVIAKIRALR